MFQKKKRLNYTQNPRNLIQIRKMQKGNLRDMGLMDMVRSYQIYMFINQQGMSLPRRVLYMVDKVKIH